jgi:hypothetical protein
MSYRFPAAISAQTEARDRDVSLAAPPSIDRDGNPLVDQRERLDWLRCAVQQGRAYLQQQRAWDNFDDAIDIIAGITRERIDPRLSNISVNLIKRDVREITEVLADIRHFYGCQTDNKQYDQQVEIQNKLSRAWAQGIGMDRYLKQSLQFASCLGNGYFRPYWNPNKYSKGRGDIDLDVYGGRDVLPIHLPRSHDLQAAHAVIVCHTMPLWEARYRWPQWADKLKPIIDSGWQGWGSAASSAWGSRIYQFFQGKAAMQDAREKERTPWPMVEVYYCYILDHSVNESGHDIAMGRPGSSWSYTVPSFNADAPESSYLYPMRRLMVGTADVILEDDTAHDWHGMAPAIKFSLDEWAWDFLGYSLVRDTARIQASLNNLRRGVNDNINIVLQPGYTYDKNVVSPTDAATFNPRIPGSRMMADHRAGIDPIKFPVPRGTYDIPQFTPQYIQYLEQLQHYVTGVADVRSMSQAAQLPASDTIEKLLEMAGPLVRGMSRSIEFPMTQLGQMNVANFLQYYSLNRRIGMLGEDGITREDFDYDPGTMIPDGEEPRAVRGRRHVENFWYQITPGSLHTIRQTSTKLLYMQLSQRFPGLIDPETLLTVMDVPNAGRVEGSTVLEKAENWAKRQRDIGLETQALQMLVQIIMTSAAQGATPGGQLSALIQQLGPALQGLANSGQPSTVEGRPPVYNKPPEIQTKGDGRQIVSTSG